MADVAVPRPEALDASRRSAPAVHDVAAKFMLDLDMYAAAAQFGYEGISFYFAGRGGVLGDVGADDVFEAFTFFPRATVTAAWESSAGIEDRAAAAERFADAGHVWATAHLLEDGVDLDRLSELAGRVIEGADPDGAPVFAGWRDLAEPEGARELALHRMNALRELRAARHGAAVREVGLEPVEAFMVRTPYMAAIFGWPAPEGEPDDATKAQWQRAEELTNQAFAQDLAVLSDAELDEFCLVSTQLLGSIV